MTSDIKGTKISSVNDELFPSKTTITRQTKSETVQPNENLNYNPINNRDSNLYSTKSVRVEKILIKV